MSAPWWLGIAPAEAPVNCDGHVHTLRWIDGELRAIDHDDPKRERALAALGGERCTCIEVLDAWAKWSDELRVLVLASRGPADPITAPQDVPAAGGPPFLLRPPRMLRSVGAVSSHIAMSTQRASVGGSRRWTAYAPPQLDIPPLHLGGGLAHRLVATVAAAWAARLDDAGDPRVAAAVPALHAALYGRVAATVRGWLDEPGLEIDVEMVAAGRPRGLSRDGERVRVTLPFSWLAEVWARQVAVTAGRFCLEARADARGGWELATLAPDLRTEATIRIEPGGAGP